MYKFKFPLRPYLVLRYTDLIQGVLSELIKEN